DTIVRDRFGRVWQRRVWSLGYTDYYLEILALPTPDGYAGLFSMSPGALHEVFSEAGAYLADYFYLTYQGSLAQWQAFLDRRALRPAVFDHVKLKYEEGRSLRFESPRPQLDRS